MKAELLKIRRSYAFWLTLTGAAFIPFVNASKLIGRPDLFESKMNSDPWAIFIVDNWAVAASFLLLVYVILVISLVVQIEYGNNTWKQVYASPRSYADIFFSKLLIINFLVVFCFLLFTIFIVAAGVVVSVVNPSYQFLSNPIPWGHLIALAKKMYLSIVAVMAIQYWLSMQIKNFIIPIGIGMILLIGGYMIRQWEYIAYYPYMHPLLVYFKNPGLKLGNAENALRNSLLEGIAFICLGFCSLRFKEEKA